MLCYYIFGFYPRLNSFTLACRVLLVFSGSRSAKELTGPAQRTFQTSGSHRRQFDGYTLSHHHLVVYPSVAHTIQWALSTGPCRPPVSKPSATPFQQASLVSRASHVVRIPWSPGVLTLVFPSPRAASETCCSQVSYQQDNMVLIVGFQGLQMNDQCAPIVWKSHMLMDLLIS